MSLKITEVRAKTILSRSGIPGADYCINAYTGCSHACTYCYATFMKRFTGHTEEWGPFVDVKLNAAEVLNSQIRKAKRGTVMLSSVTDAYQPVEKKYGLTRKCLEILLEHQFPVDILTKSPLVLRDIDLFKQFGDIDVGITITTDNEEMRRIFEPHAPSIEDRIAALRELKAQGIRTYVFIGPMLPMDPERLGEMIRDHADSVLIDRMNYIAKTANIYRRHGLMQWLDKRFIEEIRTRLLTRLKGRKVTVC